MGLKDLAEGIILQTIEDLWDEDLAGDSITFFTGKGFGLCAELAGVSLIEQVKLLKLVKGVIDYKKKELKYGKILFNQGEKGHQKRRREASSSVHNYKVLRSISHD